MYLVCIVGSSMSLSKVSSGKLYSWGRGTEGQLGLNNTENQLKPVAISEPAGILIYF